MKYEDPDKPWKIKRVDGSLVAECRTEVEAQEVVRESQPGSLTLEIWLEPREDTTRRWREVAWSLMYETSTRIET